MTVEGAATNRRFGVVGQEQSIRMQSESKSWRSERRAVGRAAGVLIALCLASIGCRDAPGPSNVVVILIDTLRADHLGHHGYARDTSPRLDALAEESVVFLAHTSHASRTGPSVASLITGLHPRSHGVVNPLTHFDAKGTLDESRLTLAEILSQSGYRSAGFVTNSNIAEKFGFAQGFAHYQLLRWKDAQALNRAVLGWLDDPADDSTSEAPLFLYVHYVDPHSSYEAPAASVERFRDPNYRGTLNGAHKQLDRVLTGGMQLEAADVRHLTALYDAEIRHVDENVGELLDELGKRGVLEDALLIVVSDHGEELFDHASLLHGYTLYEEQLHIPLLIRHPDLAPQRVPGVTRQIDVLPTLLELLEIDIPEHVQGRSLVSDLRGGGADPIAPAVYAEASLRAKKTVRKESLTSGDWKLIESFVPQRSRELYNLADDPSESRDLANERPDVADRLAAELEAFRAQLPIGSAGQVELDEAEVDELRALGYLPDEGS